MKNIIAILAVFLLLAACSQTATTTTTSGIPATETKADSLEQIKSDTLAKNDITQNLVIPLNIKKGKAGDTFVFGSVFNLVNRQPGNYIIKLDFIEGRDSSSNKIELGRDAGNAWVQSSGGFAAGEQPTFVPITVKAASSALPGTYTYDVFVYEVKEGFENKIDSINRKINVKIE